MKLLFLTLFSICLLCTCGYAQTPVPMPTGTVIIKGVVSDSVKSAALGYVTVGLLEVGKREAVKSTYTKDNGSFEFSGLPVKAYEVLITYVGFKPKRIKVPEIKSQDAKIDLGKINMAPTAGQLKEVEVTAQKQLVKQDVDKLVYDVEADPESKTINALDMLRKVPMLTVDAEDNIQLKGSGNYKVLINGKTSSLFVRNAKDVFKSMPANTIKNIEVITTPSAKYEAEGVGGIINIITNKKSVGGYNGSVNAAVRTPTGYNAGGYVTVKTGKFGVSGYFGTNYNQSPPNANNLYRLDQSNNRNTELSQVGSGNNFGYFHYIDGQLSYELDTLNLITGNYSINLNDYRNNSSQQVRFIDFINAANSENYSRLNKSIGNWNGSDMGLDWQHTFRRNKEQLFTLSYKLNMNENDSFSDFIFKERVSQTNNDGGTHEHTVQADYVHPIGKQNLETGIKTITRLSNSEYYYADQNPDNGEYIIDEKQSNNFNYRQDIYAGYTSFLFKLKDWGLRTGARLEETIVKAEFESSGKSANQDYFNLIPSVSLSRKLKKMRNIKVSYTQRIERPGLWYLNPYRNVVDRRNVFFGNPDLRPATSHAFDLSFSTFIKGSSVNSSLYHNFTNNSIQQFTNLSANGDTALTTYGNIGRNRTWGLSLNGNINATKKLNININGSMNYVQLKSAIQDNQGVTANIFGFLSYKFNKQWRASGNVGYNSPRILLQGTSSGYMFNSFSVSRTFMKEDKGSLNLNISSPFQQNRRFFNEIGDVTNGFYQSSENFFVMRRIGLSFNYRFGKLQGGIAKKKRGIQNDDVKGGQSEGGS